MPLESGCQARLTFRQIRDGVALASAQLVRSAIVKSVACSESVKAYFNSTTAPY